MGISLLMREYLHIQTDPKQSKYSLRNFKKSLNFAVLVEPEGTPVFIACHKELWIIDALDALMFSKAMRFWGKGHG